MAERISFHESSGTAWELLQQSRRGVVVVAVNNLSCRMNHTRQRFGFLPILGGEVWGNRALARSQPRSD